MQKLMYVLQFGLMAGLCLIITPPAAATPASGLLVGEVLSGAATASSLEPCSLISPPPRQRASSRQRSAGLRRKSNPASGFGRDYFRSRRPSSQRDPNSLGMRAQRWWAR